MKAMAAYMNTMKAKGKFKGKPPKQSPMAQVISKAKKG